jgi:hypothetical protein
MLRIIHKVVDLTRRLSTLYSRYGEENRVTETN